MVYHPDHNWIFGPNGAPFQRPTCMMQLASLQQQCTPRGRKLLLEMYIRYRTWDSPEYVSWSLHTLLPERPDRFSSRAQRKT